MIPLYIKRGRRYHAVQWHMPEVIDALKKHQPVY